MSTDKSEREAFEATVGAGRVLTRTANGDYVSTYVQNDWDVWQVAGKEIQRAACNFCLAEAAKARAAQPSQPATVVPVARVAVGDVAHQSDAVSEVEEIHANLAALRARLNALAPSAPAESGWQPISSAPKNTPIRLYAQGGGFYDEDFNPSGSIEGQWTDGTWCGAFWDPVHDTWFRRDDIVPTHWQPLPAAPSAAQPGGEGGSHG